MSARNVLFWVLTLLTLVIAVVAANKNDISMVLLALLFLVGAIWVGRKHESVKRGLPFNNGSFDPDQKSDP